MTDRRFGPGVVLGVLVLAGCGSPPPTTEVRGTVSLNGKPIADGTVTLLPAEPGPAKPASGLVKDGRFTIPAVPVGPKKVSITATKAVESKDKALDIMGGGPATVSILPDEFNAQTKLTAEVTAGGPNDLKFDLKTKE